MMSIATYAAVLINKFRADARGVTAVEYGLIAAFMATALIAVVPLVTHGLFTSFTTIGTQMAAAPAAK